MQFVLIIWVLLAILYVIVKANNVKTEPVKPLDFTAIDKLVADIQAEAEKGQKMSSKPVPDITIVKPDASKIGDYVDYEEVK